jgi:hypothetical protein
MQPLCHAAVQQWCSPVALKAWTRGSTILCHDRSKQTSMLQHAQTLSSIHAHPACINAHVACINTTVCHSGQRSRPAGRKVLAGFAVALVGGVRAPGGGGSGGGQEPSRGRGRGRRECWEGRGDPARPCRGPRTRQLAGTANGPGPTRQAARPSRATATTRTSDSESRRRTGGATTGGAGRAGGGRGGGGRCAGRSQRARRRRRRAGPRTAAGRDSAAQGGGAPRAPSEPRPARGINRRRLATAPRRRRCRRAAVRRCALRGLPT